MEKKEIMVMNLDQKDEEMEGARRATGISSSDTSRKYRDKPIVPDTEVTEKATRRSFTAEYKRRIIREADACKEQSQSEARGHQIGLRCPGHFTVRFLPVEESVQETKKEICSSAAGTVS